jgi:Domain of unknown function (DUF4832)
VRAFTLTIAALGLVGMLGGRRMSATQPQPWQNLTLDEKYPALDWNPLRGLVADGVGETDSTLPHSMVWVSLPLKSIMTGPSSFDWKTLDESLNKVSSHGYQAILNFYVDSPGMPSGIPQFLIDEGLQTYTYTDLENHGASVSPDYKDQRIVQAFQSFLEALAARYDGDPRIAFIVPGLYGFRGEWQVEKHSEWEMFQFNKDLLIATMGKSFKKTMLLLRHPADSSHSDTVRNFGLFDASFIKFTLGDKAWNFWRQVEQANMSAQWKTRPMAGELNAKGFEDTKAFTAAPSKEGKQALDCIRTTHLTWLAAPSLFGPKGLPSEVKKDDLLAAVRLMGYRLAVTGFIIVPDPGHGASLRIRIDNHGLAPFYGTWAVEIGVVDGNKRVTNVSRESWQMEKILPGGSEEFSAQLSASATVDSERLVMRLVPPLANGKPFRFANASQDATVEGWLTLADIKRKAP